jgi:hypothetical protein
VQQNDVKSPSRNATASNAGEFGAAVRAGPDPPNPGLRNQPVLRAGGDAGLHQQAGNTAIGLANVLINVKYLLALQRFVAANPRQQ